MKIDKLLSGFDVILNDGISSIPSIKAIDILKDYFIEYNIPIQYIGKIKFDIDETFFDDEEKAKQVLEKLAHIIDRLRDHLIINYGDDCCVKIFEDLLSATVLSLHENGEE